MARVFIGTSGWVYDHWRGSFYPEDLVRRRWLSFYADRFASVEINGSFYRLPSESTVSAWAREAPPGFRFAFKASRYLTHMKKLKPAPDSLRTMLQRADILGARLGPILFQLPPRWHVNTERLEAFLESLPRRHRYAFELRDESWWDERVYALLRGRGAATVWFDLAGRRSPVTDTARFRYVRWHGPGESAYCGRYGKNRLRALAARVREWSADGQDVYVYFDNDEAGYAPADGLALQEILTRPA